MSGVFLSLVLVFNIILIVTSITKENQQDGASTVRGRRQTDRNLLTNPREVQRLQEQLEELQKTVWKLQAGRVKRSDDAGPLEAVVAQQAQELSALKAQLQATETKLQSTANKLDAAGSTFVRWGRTTCPDGSHQVYTGVSGGAHYSHEGSGANRLCLSMEPQFDNQPRPSTHGWMYGVEYIDIPGHQDNEAPCAVCRVPQSTTIMVPSTHTCPPGWTTQYTGHLASGKVGDASPSEYLCLDGQPEDRAASHGRQTGAYFLYVMADCGPYSLPCPPYVTKVLTCVVCSM